VDENTVFIGVFNVDQKKDEFFQEYLKGNPI